VCDNGDIVMMNRTWELATGYDVVLHRYAADDGATVWATRYNSAGNTPDDPTHLIRDAGGDLLVAGVRSGNFMALKFDDADGELLWSADYDGPAGGYDAAAAILEGPAGDVIVTGFSTGTTTSWDATTVAFDPTDGALRWERHFDGGEGRPDEGKALAVSPQGDLYVTGYCDLATTATDLIALRYLLAGPTGVAGSLAGTPAPSPLRISADPNPFVLGLSFSVEIPQAGPARLAVYDVRGRQVALLHEGGLERGPHRIGWDGRNDSGEALGSGVYFLRLESGRSSAVRKVVRTR
jgi:hypothetical protein